MPPCSPLAMFHVEHGASISLAGIETTWGYRTASSVLRRSAATMRDMSRVRSWLSNMVMALSLLALAGVVFGWIWSYLSGTTLIESQNGKLMLIGVDAPTTVARQARDVTTFDNFLASLTAPVNLNGITYPPPQEHHLMGFQLLRGTAGTVYAGSTFWTGPYWIFSIPYWFLSLVAATFPAFWLRQRARAAHLGRANCCPQCSYDLRGNISGVCPECGSAVRTARPSNTPSQDAGHTA